MAQGVMYVEILPSTKGIGKAVERDASAAFKGAEQTGSSFFSKVGTWAKRGALAVTGMVAAVGALAVGGGISRALNIEDAQAKLKGLGHDTKAVEAIMNDALASVKGTAFGLDTAATVAATAVAAGIKPGKELEKYLRLTADAATIAGVSMEEMGSILNKATTAGKVYTQELNQLADRGLPIFQWLQEEYKVSAEELRKMVADGKVDAETFRKVIEENIGGAALASGDTTRGAFANMRAALSRLGLAFIGDGLSGAKTFFNEITVMLDGLTSRVGPAISALGERFGGMFNVDGSGERFLNFLDTISTKIGPVLEIASHFTPLGAALKTLQPLLDPLGEAFSKIGAVLKDQLAAVLPILASTFAAIGVALVPLVPVLAELVIAVLNLVTPLLTLLEPIAQLLEVLLPPLVSLLVFLISTALDPTMQALEGLAAAFEFLAPYVAMFIDWLTQATNANIAFWQQVSVVWEQFRAVTAEVFAWVRDFLKSIWEQIGLLIGGALKIIVGLFTGNFALVREGLAQFANAAHKIWENVVTFFAQGVVRVVAAVQQIGPKIRSALAGAGTWLVQAGRDIIQGLITGVASMVSRAVQSVVEIGGKMLSGVKGFLGIKSPSRVFRDEVGKMVGLGLLEGIDDSSIRSRIDSSVRHMIEVPAMGATTVTDSGPSVFHLYDENGTLMATFKGMLGAALAPVSPGPVMDRFGVRA